jgi:hypothetical protein
LSTNARDACTSSTTLSLVSYSMPMRDLAAGTGKMTITKTTGSTNIATDDSRNATTSPERDD